MTFMAALADSQGREGILDFLELKIYITWFPELKAQAIDLIRSATIKDA